MSAVKIPRSVAFDSSHLGAWARDWASGDSVQRARAQALEAQSAATGWVPLVCWHHFEELLNTNEAEVQVRIEFLCSLPVVGWVAHRGGEAFPGGIIDVVGAELQAALRVFEPTAAEVREAARGSIVRVGSGREAFEGFRTIWRNLLPHIRRRAEDTRRNVAITRATFNDTDNVKVNDLLKGRFRDTADQSAAIETMTARLADEVRTHCTMQLWSPDKTSEVHLYVNDAPHGYAITDLPIDTNGSALFEIVNSAADRIGEHLEGLSAVRDRYWPIVLTACRHHRLPVPPGFWIKALSRAPDAA